MKMMMLVMIMTVMADASNDYRLILSGNSRNVDEALNVDFFF